jgi:hypothetical protein
VSADELTGLDLEHELMRVLPAYVRATTGPPEEHVMACALAVVLDELVHDAPDVARTLLKRCSAVVARADDLEPGHPSIPTGGDVDDGRVY